SLGRAAGLFGFFQIVFNDLLLILIFLFLGQGFKPFHILLSSLHAGLRADDLLLDITTPDRFHLLQAQLELFGLLLEAAHVFQRALIDEVIIPLGNAEVGIGQADAGIRPLGNRREVVNQSLGFFV